jgi:Protein of unknown function (DUF3305)
LSPATPLVRVPVGVVVERRKAASPWVDHVWRPVAALAGRPDTAPWTALVVEPDATTYYAGAADIELYRSETANYRDNLSSGAPALWVVLRPTGIEPPFDITAVTADPAEGEGYTQAGTDLVEPVAMPGPIREVVEAFVAEHHVEQPFYKRRRDRADPAGRHGRPGEGDDE